MVCLKLGLENINWNVMREPYKILLCEDEEFVSRMYVQKLKLEGFMVFLAKNGKEAFEKIKSEKPHLVILDLMMPLLSGFEVLQAVQNDTDNDIKNIPIIIASNLSQESDRSEAARLGARDFIVKSNISLKEMVAKVREYLPEQNSD